MRFWLAWDLGRSPVSVVPLVYTSLGTVYDVLMRNYDVHWVGLEPLRPKLTNNCFYTCVVTKHDQISLETLSTLPNLNMLTAQIRQTSQSKLLICERPWSCQLRLQSFGSRLYHVNQKLSHSLRNLWFLLTDFNIFTILFRKWSAHIPGINSTTSP